MKVCVKEFLLMKNLSIFIIVFLLSGCSNEIVSNEGAINNQGQQTQEINSEKANAEQKKFEQRAELQRLRLLQAKQRKKVDCNAVADLAVTKAQLTVDLKQNINLFCSVYGYMIGAPEGKQWLKGYDKLNSINIPRLSVMPSWSGLIEAETVYYFSTIDQQELVGDKKIEWVESLRPFHSEMVETFSLKDDRLYEITTVNNLEITQKVYLYKQAGGETLGYLCNPDCDPKLLFAESNYK